MGLWAAVTIACVLMYFGACLALEYLDRQSD